MRELAEDAAAYTPTGPDAELLRADGFVARFGPLPWHANVQRIRLDAADVGGAVERVRGLLRERGRREVSWWLGPSSRPLDLHERLLAAGLVPATRPPYAPAVTALAILGPPRVPPTRIETRIAETLEEHELAAEIAATGFGFDEQQRRASLAAVAAGFEARNDPASPVTFLAWVDGRPVARASAVFCERGALLIGGATLPEARGRGAYSALVAARWREAVRRGTPALVVQAVEASQPILQRLGFRTIGEMRILLDELESEPAASP